MITWFQNLDTLSLVFLCVAMPTSLVFLIQLVMSLIGLGDDGLDGADAPDDMPDGIFGDGETGDIGVDADGVADFHFFSLRTIIAFLMTFGWVGFSMAQIGLHIALCLSVAFVAGAVMMLVIALLLMFLNRLQDDGTMNIRDAVGKTASVYLTIPPKGQGMGKVNLTLQGSYRELDAIQDGETPLSTGSQVRVVGVRSSDTLIVMSLD